MQNQETLIGIFVVIAFCIMLTTTPVWWCFIKFWDWKRDGSIMVFFRIRITTFLFCIQIRSQEDFVVWKMVRINYNLSCIIHINRTHFGRHSNFFNITEGWQISLCWAFLLLSWQCIIDRKARFQKNKLGVTHIMNGTIIQSHQIMLGLDKSRKM